MLHRFAQFLAGCTVLLVLAGSLVTSTASGLAVPDWPTTYGWNMFTFPPSKWVGGILYEHGHRLIASTVGFLSIILAVWLWLQEPRRWMKWLGVAALGAVIAQGVLGGLTVLFFLPAAISTAHAGLAEIFFCLVVSIALVTSPGWIDGYGSSRARETTLERSARSSRERRSASEASGGGAPRALESVFSERDGGRVPLTRARETTLEREVFSERGWGPASHKNDETLRKAATTATGLIYIQILLGATMRHTGAGLAIPDFPLMFGHLLPTHWDPKIAIHFSHRVGALVVVLGVLATCAYIWRRHGERRELTRPAALLLALVGVQVTLGALTVLSQRDIWINSVHVVCGALVLATSLVLTLRSWRGKFADERVPQPLRTPRHVGLSSATSASSAVTHGGART